MTSYLICALGLLGFYLAFALTVEKLNARLELPDRNWIDRVSGAAMILIVVLVIGGGWRLAIGESQLKPHVITTSINGHLLSTFTATNPAYVTWESKWVWTNGEQVLVNIPQTNYYWQVWSIFRKS